MRVTRLAPLSTVSESVKVLAINCGSSSIKFAVVNVGPDRSDASLLTRGRISDIGASESSIRLNGRVEVYDNQPVPDHREGIRKIFGFLNQREELAPSSLDAAGHRFVHGGDALVDPVVVDQEVLSALEALSHLAPLHNPIALSSIRETQTFLGERVPMVCVFDTAFHRAMPAVASTYAIPHELAIRHRIKRYGFHGIAHESLLQGYLAFLGPTHRRDRLITLHLGSGCSITALEAGQSVDTSMGFTPLEGLLMGTRSGNLDPTIVPYLADKEHVSCSEVVEWLHHRSGLLGVSGKSADVRVLLNAMNRDHDEQATLAVELFCYHARKYLGAYLAALGGADAIIFGGGIGESSPEIRNRLCENMAWCGLEIDPAHNQRAVNLAPGTAACISPSRATLSAYVVAADEETTIARQTVDCLTRFHHH